MARLIVDVQGTAGTGVSSGAARPNNNLPLTLVASVTRTSGRPVTALPAYAFQVFAIMVGPGGSWVTVSGVTETPAPLGFYTVKLVPYFPGATWKLGRYIFGVKVTTADDFGQTVCSVFVD
jgi:hypothetical protein